MKNVLKTLGFIALIAIIGISLTTCDSDSGNGNNNNNDNDNGGTTGDGTMTIGSKLYGSEIPIYDYDYINKEIIPFEYDSSIELTGGSYGSAFSKGWGDDHIEINASIMNNKLYFDIGEIPDAKLFPLRNPLTSNASNVKGIELSTLTYN